MSKFENSGKLPSQTVTNPKENVNDVVLRSGKELVGPNEDSSSSTKVHRGDKDEENKQKISSQVIPSPTTNKHTNSVPLPFPSRVTKSKKEEHEREILETFQKVEVNIPLLDAIKQVPRYAKFLKELCTSKRRVQRDEKLSVVENISAVIHGKLP